MNVLAIRDRMIAEGIQAVRKLPDPYAAVGAEYGFALCKTFETPQQFVGVLTERYQVEATLERNTQEHHEYRMATLQVEFVFNVMCVAWGIPQPSRGALHRYIEIVGRAVQRHFKN